MPPQIVVPRGVGDVSALAEFLSERRGSRVEVRKAERGEKLFVLVPALLLLNERRRQIPRVLFITAAATALGGLVYRFTHTTLAFRYGHESIYFPTIGELLMWLGYIGMAIALFIVAVRRFAILPDRISD